MTEERCFALLGSGEFEPWSEEVDRYVLERARSGDGSVLILPTASAPEGDDVFVGWAQKGLDHFAGVGFKADVLPLKTRNDAMDARFVQALDVPSIVYLSGGNPAYLARTFSDTPFWTALLDGVDRGLAYIGCSAGVAFLGELAPDSAAAQQIADLKPWPADIWVEGMRVFPKTVFGPHWNMLDVYIPGLQAYMHDSVPDDCWLVGIDENTAMAGDGSDWQVFGLGTVVIHKDDDWRTHPAGESFSFSRIPAGVGTRSGSRRARGAGSVSGRGTGSTPQARGTPRRRPPAPRP
jgi:cyanophycinase